MFRFFSVSVGKSLMEAMHEEGVSVNAPCGGNHSCGKCRVRVAKGNIPPACEEEVRLLSAKEIAEGWRLACAIYGPGEWMLEVPEQDVGARVMMDGTKDEAQLDPSAHILVKKIAQPTLEDQRSDAERTAAGMNLTIETLKKLPRAMRGGENVYLACFDGDDRLVTDCSDQPMENIGMAVDVGTTTMAAYLIDLNDGTQLACESAMNPQRSFGGDVISRVDYATNQKGGLERMQMLVAKEIERLGVKMLEKTGNAPENMRHIVCVGNTIMMHLLAGLETIHIAKAPFTPVYADSWSAPAKELNMNFSKAYITLGTCVAGYVGADTIAAALACGMDCTEEIQLLVDIGTNGEIALGNQQGMICCSAAAGPAFEGAHIRCGGGAQNGAIDHVKMADGQVTCSVLGGGEPKLICGSGLVDAIAEMMKEGIIDETGRIDEDEAPEEYEERIFDFEGNPAFSLDGKGVEGVFVCQQDIREVQLAKAAIAAGVQALVKEANVSFDQVKRLCLAGGFGNYIDQASAVEVGLLPDELSDRIFPVGNAAGTGARQMLKNRDWIKRADMMRRKMRYIELSAMSDFQELFVEKMMFGRGEY